MPEDSKYILIFVLSMLPFAIWGVNAKPQLEDWNAKDPQVQFFRKSLYQLFAKGNEPNILFLGTSRTMNGVHTPKLNQELKKQNDYAYNLAINWFGHGIQLSQLESWLKFRSKPKLLVVEVPMLFRWNLHPHFQAHHSAGALRALWGASPYRALKSSLVEGPRQVAQPYLNFNSISRSRDLSDGYLEIEQSEQERSRSEKSAMQMLKKGPVELNPTTAFKDKLRVLRYQAQLNFLSKIHMLCQLHGIELRWLLMPKCGFQKVEPVLLQKYEEMAPVWVPPWELIQKPELWRDSGHLNQKGAGILADWLLVKLRAI